MVLLFFKGFCAGFFYAFLSISAMILLSSITLEKRQKIGCMACVGLSLVESIYSLLASLVLLALNFFAPVQNSLYIFLASTFLFFMAVQIYRNPNRSFHRDSMRFSNISLFSYRCLTVLLTPVRILGYATIFVCLQVYPNSFFKFLWLTFGVFLGSCLWWILYIISMRKGEKENLTKMPYRLYQYSALVLVLFAFLGIFQVL